ncbi:hypothetical protein [Pararhodobacter sp. CCB-MM2]|uniref:hypothetical protein n=1 Tax=Pararhodobacter sp. CCB-MM2 TaxID=1786003 RepID=UPI001313DE18|nr:hypothetical protein [Pararhodobacter sp. CCB-MM2]MCA2010195.1 hypothetical protein [Cereibacter sphaeroides]
MPRYNDGPGFFGYLFRLVLILVLVGGVGFVAFAYFGDLGRAPEPRSLPVDLQLG